MLRVFLIAAASFFFVGVHNLSADAVVFFNSAQVAQDVASGATSDTIKSNGYIFTYTRDKFFTGGVGLTEPVGRFVSVSWPTGVQAQAVTAGPVTGKARITLSREDGALFGITAFTAKLLANTFGTGAEIEVVPKLNGEEVLNDPIFLDASGSGNQSFNYSLTGGYRHDTSALHGYDSYEIGLFVDFAITALTLQGPPVVVPEPASLVALGMTGLILMGGRRGRKTPVAKGQRV